MSRRVDALRALAERGATAGEREAARVALGVHTAPRPRPARPTPPAAAGDRFAQPCKLDSGAWGVLVRWPVELGDVVTVRARDGRTWSQRIVSIEWERNGATACSTADVDPPWGPPDLTHRRDMSYAALRDLLVALAGSHALLLAQVEMQGFDRKERRRHLDTLISRITGRPPSPT